MIVNPAGASRRKRSPDYSLKPLILPPLAFGRTSYGQLKCISSVKHIHTSKVAYEQKE